MVRLPLLINKQRIKTLEELRENFNLTELIERHKGGQLRAWLNCWDFSSELEQVEALSPDLPEQELLEALCRIFGVEGEAKEQTLTAFREEQEKREEEAKRRKEQQEAEERAKTSIAKPLTLDEIEFDWQEAEGPKIDLLTSGADRFVAIADKRGYYSYNGIQWERANLKWKDNYACRLYCCNGNFILDYGFNSSATFSKVRNSSSRAFTASRTRPFSSIREVCRRFRTVLPPKHKLLHTWTLIPADRPTAIVRS